MVEKNFDPLDELICLLTNNRKVSQLTVNEHANLLLKCMAYAYPKLRQVEHQVESPNGEFIIRLGGIHDPVEAEEESAASDSADQ